MIPRGIPILKIEGDEDEASVETEQERPVKWKKTSKVWSPGGQPKQVFPGVRVV